MSALRQAKVLAILLAAAAAVLPAAARASKADAFENKIEPVSGQLYQKAHRFELTLPSANLSLNDAFFHKYFLGVKAGYHFSEVLSIGATFGLGLASQSGSTSICTRDGCTDATTAQLYQLPGHIGMMAGGEIGFSPIYGKLNVLAEVPLHFDLSLLAGVDSVQYRAALESSQANATASSGGTPPSQSSIGGHVGVGVRMFLSDSMALRLELKDYIYTIPIGNDLNQKDMQNQLFTELGLSFFFPFGYKANP